MSQLVSTIRAGITSTAHHGQKQESIGLSPPPHLVGDSINGARETVSSAHIWSTFGWTGRRYHPLNNSTISSVMVNGKSYQGPIFDKRGNRRN